MAAGRKRSSGQQGPGSSTDGKGLAGGGTGQQGGDEDEEQEEEEEEEEEDVHKYFDLMGSANAMQASLERAEVARCLRLMGRSSWVRFHEDVRQMAWSQLWTRPARAAGRALMAPLLRHAADLSAKMVRESVDESFDKQEFLEGASVALQTVLSSVAPVSTAHDRLRGMVSEKLLETLVTAVKKVEKEEVDMPLLSVEAEVPHSIELAGCNLWGPASVRQFDRDWVREVTPSTSRSWLVLTVAAECTVHAAYSPPSASREGSEAASSERVWQTLYKSGHVLFARGPLPRGAQPRLHGLPWRIIGML